MLCLQPSSKDSSSSKPAPFAALSSLAANLASSKDGSSHKLTPTEKTKMDAGSFLFADPIRLGAAKSSSSGRGAAGLSLTARAEAAARSTNKPLDNSRYGSLGKKSSSSGGGAQQVSILKPTSSSSSLPSSLGSSIKVAAASASSSRHGSASSR